MDQFNNKNFKNLQAKWYKKAGYEVELSEDTITDRNHTGNYLYHEYGHQNFTAKQRYYELAGQFLYTYKFKDSLQKEMWELHSEGKTVREIAAHLKASGKIIQSKSPVHRTIKYLKEEMVKKYAKEDDSE